MMKISIKPRSLAYLLLAIFIVLLSIMCLRALLIPKHGEFLLEGKTDDINVFRSFPGAITHLSQAIQLQTIAEPRYYRPEAFEKFISFLNTAHPEVNAKLARKEFGQHALLYEWKGTNSGAPAIILMSHYDVVPIEDVEQAKWSEPPFSGNVKGNYIWGRGALDDKSGVIGILEAVEHLLKSGYQPKQTIYLAFGADEETGGLHGNFLIAEYLINKGKKIAYVLDEGLPINQGIIPGVNRPVATVGVAEKGYVSIRLVSKVESGHASIPGRTNSIVSLSKILIDMQENKLPIHWDPVLNKMFHDLLPTMTFPYRLIFANLWLTRPLVIHNFLKKPTTHAIIATTETPTIIRAGIADNVVPSSAEAIVNFRLISGYTTDDVLAYVIRLVHNDNVSVSLYGNMNRDPISAADLDSADFQMLKQTIQKVFPGVVTTPSIMVAGTDSRYYAPLTHNIFRFYPWLATTDDIKEIHGINERISVGNFLKSIFFYEELIKNSDVTARNTVPISVKIGKRFAPHCANDNTSYLRSG